MELTRDDVRRPDVVQAELRKGFTWTVQHTQLVSALVGLALLGGIGYAVWSGIRTHKEEGLQEKFQKAESAYLQKKEKFDLYKNTVEPVAGSKTPAKPQGEKPSGQLDADFGPEITAMKDLLKEAPQSKAAALSALTLAQMYRDYGRGGEAVEFLKSADKAGGTLGALAAAELASAQADAGDCKTALSSWDSLVKNKNASFLAPQMKLKMGLCYESLGQTAQAEESYKAVIAEAKESAAGRSAEKWLRLLQAGSSARP